MNYEIDGIVHSETYNGYDTTLCDLSIHTIKDEFADIGIAKETNKKITCPDCLAIISFCKKIKI